MRRRLPNELTDREREVLELLRRDFTNEQIAQRLGISLDGAKYHVSQILSKLGVATREEAAAIALVERRRWWAAWPLWARIAGAATAAASLVGLAMLAWGVLRTGGGDQSDSPVEALRATQPTFGPGSFDLTVYGQLVRIDGTMLIVRRVGSLAAEVGVQVRPDTLITRRGEPVGLAEAQVGQFVFAFLKQSTPMPSLYQAVVLRIDEPGPDAAAMATPTPTIDPSTVRPCSPADVVVGYAGGNGAMMSIFSFYGFGNRSDSACKLIGPPSVVLLDASGAELGTSVSLAPPCPSDSDFCVESGPIVLAPGFGEVKEHGLEPGQAMITLVWSNSNGGFDCGSPQVALVRFVMADGSNFDGDIRESSVGRMAPCEGRVSIWAFRLRTEPSLSGQ
jgi:DNA-binding CsgD family transcriptional regulator